MYVFTAWGVAFMVFFASLWCALRVYAVMRYRYGLSVMAS